MVPKESRCPCLPALLRGQHPGLTVLPGLEFLPSVAVFMTFWSILGDDYPFLGIYKNTSYTAAWSLSRVRLCDSMDCIDHQAPLSMGFPRQKHWSGLPFPSPVDLPHPRIYHGSPALRADSLVSEPPGKCVIIWPVAVRWLCLYVSHSSDSFLLWPVDAPLSTRQERGHQRCSRPHAREAPCPCSVICPTPRWRHRGPLIWHMTLHTAPRAYGAWFT